MSLFLCPSLTRSFYVSAPRLRGGDTREDTPLELSVVIIVVPPGGGWLVDRQVSGGARVGGAQAHALGHTHAAGSIPVASNLAYYALTLNLP